MNSRNQISIVVALICFCTAWSTIQLAGFAEPKVRQDDDVRLFMRAKLTSSQKLLEGLVVEDFKKIQAGASEMHRLSKGGNWPQTQDKVYNHFNTAFQMQCEKIEALAEKKNLEGIKFAYLQLTTSCVDCHNYVRKRFEVKRPANKKGPVQLIPTYWDDKK